MAAANQTSQVAIIYKLALALQQFALVFINTKAASSFVPSQIDTINAQ
jgi:hypothetical protein